MNMSHPVNTIYGGFRDQFGALWGAQLELLKKEFGQEVLAHKMPGSDSVDILTVWVSRESAHGVFEFLRKSGEFEYNFLVDITATDEQGDPTAKSRFELVYHLLSPSKGARVRIKVPLMEGEEATTVVDLWPGANWAEREVWDMFGIRFAGHPNMRRILMDERWQGHPLRKDYPLRGYQFFQTPAEVDPSQLEG